MYNLRGGFLIRPLGIALTLGFLGAVLSSLEESAPPFSDSHADPQVAQIILAGIAASIMTVVSIVFAILLMSLTLASMQFSPRIIISFSRDRVTQWTLGIFLGTFCYCMAALPAARSLPKPVAPWLTVLGAMALALVCVAWLLFFIHHISRAISVSHIVDRIASETEAVVADVMPKPRREIRLAAPPVLFDQDHWHTAVVSETSGYIRFVDVRRLVAVAKSFHVKAHAMRRVGQFVPAGAPLLTIYKGERLSPEAAAELRAGIDIGPARTLQQDIEFGVLQIVDIALKAISPAVNDPTTAINCIDQLSRVLIRVGAHEPPEPHYYDPPGVLRLTLPWIGFEGLLDSAFEQIRLYAKADMAVSLRLLRAFADIGSSTPVIEIRAGLADRGRRIVDGCAERLGEHELHQMRSRLETLEKIAAAPPD
jgi:uncharacterized membrane protein